MKDKRRIRLDFNNVMAQRIGPEHGLTHDDLREIAESVPKLHARLEAGRTSGEIGFYALPYERALISKARKRGEEIRRRFDAVVVLGIGGSALGMTALASAFLHPYHNELPREKRRAPKIYVADNIDPEMFEGLLGTLDLKRTLFNVITKSGTTAETVAQFLLARELLRRTLGRRHASRIVVTTTESKGALSAIARVEGYELFPIPENVGGRFSVLSAVGLLPAAAVGIDVGELVSGARLMDERTKLTDFWRNPAYMAAALQYLLDRRKGKHISVMFVYSHALRDIGDWFRQLWAESLGKKFSLERKVVHVGPTPVKALGVTDQHSQMQLYVEGPNDKVVTFLAAEHFGKSLLIPVAFPNEPDMAYLGSHTMEELFHAERIGTELALSQANRPNATIYLHEVSPFEVGQLLFMFEVQTAFAALLYGVNAFDQPGVEAGKVAAYAAMGRPGFEDEARRIASRPAAESHYIIA